MRKLTLFNHKGGVGKTTLSINLAQAIKDLGYCVLMVDVDPQCNLSSFYLEECELDALLGESSDDQENTEGTIWSSIKPIVRGRGDIKEVELFELDDNLYLFPGDVLLSEYEEELPEAWTASFARRPRGYDVTCAISKSVNIHAQEVSADIVIYDCGPNVGALNRVILLDSSFFITPVAADLFSLRALTTVGRSIAKWAKDWKTILDLVNGNDKKGLLKGKPAYLGYIATAFKVWHGKTKANPHTRWENKIAPRVSKRVVDVLSNIDKSLVADIMTGSSPNKIGDVKNYHSLAAAAQEAGIPIGHLRGKVNTGQNRQVDEAKRQFANLARNVVARMGMP